jgi:hypothetical protein
MKATLIGCLASLLACGSAAGTVGCGAGQAATEAKSTGTGQPPPTTSSSASASSADVAGPPSTTAVTLGDGGDLQGAKLSESRTIVATDGGAPSPGRSAHSHEPGRGPADIRAVIVAHRDEARACYDKALDAHPGIEGDLVVQWTIDPKGNVTQVSLDATRSQITEAGVVACVGNVIRKVQFAASPGGFETKAFYPFNFHPRHAGGGQPRPGASP